MALTVLDAGVVIAFLDGDDPHHLAARNSMAAAATAGDEFIVPVSAYSEALVRPFVRGLEAVGRVEGLIDELPARVEGASRSIGRTAAALRARHGTRLRLPDALVLATATEVNADRVLTTDRGWPNTGIVVHIIGGG